MYPGRKRLLTVEVVVHRQAQLLEIVRARRLAGGFAGMLNGRQHERDEHADDADHDQNLNEREARRLVETPIRFERHQSLRAALALTKSPWL